MPDPLKAGTYTASDNALRRIGSGHVRLAQASSSFKLFDTRTFTYATPTFITESHSFVTQVQLLLTTVTVN